MIPYVELFRKRIFPFAFAAAAILYLALFVAILPHDSIWISDEGNRVNAVRSYAETGEAFLPDPLAGLRKVPEEGLRAYPPPYFVQNREGRWRSGYTAFFPWTASFLYRAAGQLGLILIPLAGGLLSILAAGWIAKELGMNERNAACTMLLCAFGTPFLFYSGVFLEPTTAAFFATLGIWLALRATASPKEPLYLLCAGVACGISTLFREEGLILTAAVMLALAVTRFSWKRIGAFGAGALLVLVPLMIFNHADSGSVFGLHAVVYSGLGEVRKYPFWIAKLRDYSMYLTLLSMPFPILNGLPAVLLIGGGIFCSWRKTAEYAEFVFYPLTVLACLFSTVYNIAANDSGRLIHQSLLDHLPLIAPCVFSLVLLFRESGRDVRFLAWCAAGVVLATPLLLNEEHVGIFWGGRHFITVIPVICVLTVHLLASGKLSRMAKYGTAALIFASVAANAAGYGFLLCKKTFSQDLVRTLNNPEVKTIVTDVFWLPEELAWLPRDKRIIFMTKADSIERVEALCRANGIAEFHTVLGLYFRVLSNDSVARVFETNRTLPGRLFRNDRLKLFTVQIFRTVLSEPVSGKDKQAKKD